MKRSETVECPTCKSSPGEPCAALAANGVTRLGYIPIAHSARQVAAAGGMTAIELLDALRDDLRAARPEPRRPGIVYMCALCHVCSADEVHEARHVCSRCARERRKS